MKPLLRQPNLINFSGFESERVMRCVEFGVCFAMQYQPKKVQSTPLRIVVSSRSKGRASLGWQLRNKISVSIRRDGYPMDARPALYAHSPVYLFNDWREAVVGTVAHEVAHFIGQPGTAQGEYICELFSVGAVEAWRHRPDPIK